MLFALLCPYLAHGLAATGSVQLGSSRSGWYLAQLGFACGRAGLGCRVEPWNQDQG